MTGDCGCFVCGKDHRDSDKLLSSEVSDAVKLLKEKVPSELITVCGLNATFDMCERSDADDEPGNAEEVRWIKDDEQHYDFEYL